MDLIHAELPMAPCCIVERHLSDKRYQQGLCVLALLSVSNLQSVLVDKLGEFADKRGRFVYSKFYIVK